MVMSELGAFLRRHREERGFTLEDVEAATRIRRTYLEALELGAWESLPPGVFTRGLLKSYARALGVSHASVMRMYVKERPEEARLPEPQLISRPLVNEPRISLEVVLAMVIMGAAVVTLYWIARSYVLPAVQMARLDATAPVASGTVSVTPPPSTPATPGAGGTPVASLSGATSTRAAAATVAPLASPTRSPTPTTPVSGLVVDIRATGNAWLRVFTDDENVFEGFLREGDARQFAADARVRVRMGNAGDTLVTLNGRQLDALGQRGEVITREWRLLPDGNIEQIDQPE